jgi:hypothetical protein
MMVCPAWRLIPGQATGFRAFGRLIFNKGMVRYAFFIWLYAIFVERISSYSVNHRVARVLFLCESVFAPAMNEADLV